MLQRLDTIDWAALTHAHGPATDVPRLLRAFLSADADVRGQSCAELHETIWHQGTVYPASAAAVPFLCELLSCPDNPDPGCCVSLIGAIATGTGWIQYGLRVDGEQTMRQRLAKTGRTLEASLADERAVLQAIHREVSPHLRRLLPYLKDREGLATLVAELLGNFPEHATWLVPAIDAALVDEFDEDVRKVLAESKTRLAKT